MRQTISGLVAAAAVMTAGAAPAFACGYASCSPCAGYVSPCAQTYVPTVVGAGCGTGCGWAYERLAEPTTQYYPTTQYSPTTQYYYVNQGPTYSGPGMFAPYPTYQENAVSGWGGYERPYRYGYAPRHYGYMRHHYGHGVPLRRYY